MKATIKQFGKVVFLNFFNSKEIYSIKGFDTERKAKNFAKKFGYTLFDKLPEGVLEYQQYN